MTDNIFQLSSGRRLAYTEFGDPQGALLFYFHGWPASRFQGQLLDEAGKKCAVRVITPDRPGIGLSDFHPGRTLQDWPPVVSELAANFNADKFYVLGLSGGGPYALVSALMMPERLHGVGVCCGAPPLGKLGTADLIWVYKLALWARRWFSWGLPPGLWVTEKIMRQRPGQWPLRWLIATLGGRDREVMNDPDKFHLITRSGRAALRSGSRAVRCDGDIYSSDWGFDPSAIQIPVRFWHGGSDRNIPATYTQRLAAMLPQATVKIFPEDGHYSLPLRHMTEIVGELVGATPVQA